MIKRAITPQDERLVMLDDMALDKLEFDSAKKVVVARVRTPPDQVLALLREEAHRARADLSRTLRTLLIKKTPRGKIGSGKIGLKAVISYLAAMMVQAIAETKESMPPSLAALLRDLLCGSDPKLLTTVCADLAEQNAIDRAATEFAADEAVSINKVTERLGLSRKVVVELFKRGFKEEVRKWRDTITAAQKYGQESVKR
jgi:hypothetical protein